MTRLHCSEKAMSLDRPVVRGALGGPALALLLALGACESVPMASPQEDATAKRFERSDPDRGTLYVYRRGWLAIAKNVDVSIANGPRAALASDTYLMLAGPPGPIEVACKADNNTDTCNPAGGGRAARSPKYRPTGARRRYAAPSEWPRRERLARARVRTLCRDSNSS
jgi:hypothetical protein